MFGIVFSLSDDGETIRVAIDHSNPRTPSEDDLKRAFQQSDFSSYFLLEDNLTLIASQIAQIPKPSVGENEQPSPPVLLDTPIAQRRDSALEIEISSDSMQAVATLTAPCGGDILGQDGIVTKIKAAGIKKGFKKEEIAKLIAHETEGKPGQELTVVVAEGAAPEPGQASYFEYCVTPIQDRVLVPQEREDGTIDMHDLGEIETVEPGDPLMRIVPAEPGANGYNVLGEVVFSKTPPNKVFTVGEGTKVDISDNLVLLAAQAGVPLKIKDGMTVSEVLIVNNADLKVGNIDYDGNVLIKGNVVSGVKVKATGDVIVNGYVESGHLEAGNSVVVKQGIIGKELEDHSERGAQAYSTQIVAGHSITARYAQHAYLEAGDEISVTTQLLHCECHSGDQVNVGHTNQRKSKMLGGLVCVGRLLTAGVLGAPSNVKTLIDFSQPFQKLDEQIEVKKQELETQEELVVGLQEALGELKQQKPTPELIKHCRKIDNTIAHVKNLVVDIKKQIEALSSERKDLIKTLRVDVYGQVFMGVEFHIGDKIYRITDDRGACVIRFNEDRLIFS